MNKESRNKKLNKSWWSLIAFIVVLILMIVVLWVLAKGNTITIGDWSGEFNPESLTCNGKNIDYPFYTSDASTSNSIEIKALFEKDKIATISLILKANYENANNAKKYSDAHEGDINISYSKNSLKPYSFNATFTSYDKTNQMTLYAENNNLNNTTVKYFLLNNLPKNTTEYEKAYVNAGFDCKVTKEQNNS